MKFKILILIGLLVLLGVVGASAADNYINSEVYTIAGVVSIDVSAGTKPFYLTSVLMAFPDSVEVNNTFSVEYIRGGVRFPMMSITSATMNSVTWFLPGRVYFKYGDRLRFVNTDVTAGHLTLNSEF